MNVGKRRAYSRLSSFLCAISVLSIVLVMLQLPWIMQVADSGFRTDILHPTAYDETYYALLIQKKADGNTTPILWEHRLDATPRLMTPFAVQPALLKTLSSLVRWGANPITLFMLIRIISLFLIVGALTLLLTLFYTPFRAFLLSFCVLATANLFTDNGVTSYVFSMMGLGGVNSTFHSVGATFLPFLRVPSPALIYPVLLTAIWLTLFVAKTRRFSLALLHIPLLLLLRYSYMTFFNGFFVFYGTFWLFFGLFNRVRLQSILFLLVTPLVGIGLLINIFYKLDVVSNNIRSPYLSFSFLFIALFVLLFTIKRIRQKHLPLDFFEDITPLIFVATPLVLLNLQLVTHSTLHISNYNFYLSWFFVSIGYLLYFKAFFENHMKIIFVGALLVLSVESAFSVMNWRSLTPEFAYAKNEIEALPNKRDIVILTSSLDDAVSLGLSSHIFSYTSEHYINDLSEKTVGPEAQNRTLNMFCVFQLEKRDDLLEVISTRSIGNIFFGQDRSYPALNGETSLPITQKELASLAERIKNHCKNFSLSSLKKYRLDYILTRADEVLLPEVQKNAREEKTFTTPLGDYHIYKI